MECTLSKPSSIGPRGSGAMLNMFVPGCSPFWPSLPSRRCHLPFPLRLLCHPLPWGWMKRLLPLRLPSPRYPPLLRIPARTTAPSRPFLIPPPSLPQLWTSPSPARRWKREQRPLCPLLRWKVSPMDPSRLPVDPGMTTDEATSLQPRSLQPLSPGWSGCPVLSSPGHALDTAFRHRLVAFEGVADCVRSGP